MIFSMRKLPGVPDTIEVLAHKDTGHGLSSFAAGTRLSCPSEEYTG